MTHRKWEQLVFKPLMIFLLFTFIGCQAAIYGTASDFEGLSLGMTKAEVIRVLVSPVAVHADGDKGVEYLIYKRMKHVISEWARTYQVTLRNGTVVKYGEQYEEQNVNRF